jgi:hypothetical protein
MPPNILDRNYSPENKTEITFSSKYSNNGKYKMREDLTRGWRKLHKELHDLLLMAYC